jgi:hypothetical protein
MMTPQDLLSSRTVAKAVPEHSVSLAYRLFDSVTSRGCVLGGGISEVLGRV